MGKVVELNLRQRTNERPQEKLSMNAMDLVAYTAETSRRVF